LLAFIFPKSVFLNDFHANHFIHCKRLFSPHLVNLRQLIVAQSQEKDAQVNQSNSPTTPAPVEEIKPAAMPAAPQPAQPATNQPKPATTQPTDHAGEKKTP
jgi:hypothetical protein